MLFLPLLSMLLFVAQGDALQLKYAHRDGMSSVEVRWQNQKIPLLQSGDSWVTIIGVDLDLDAGDYAANVTFQFSDGREEEHKDVIRVVSKSFPETHLTVEPRYVDLSPEDLARSNRESRHLEQIFTHITPEIYWDGGFLTPIPNTVTSNFGHRRVFNLKPRNPHSGVDISAKAGTPVCSSNRGKIADVGDYFFNGKTVIVDHGLGIYSVYLHLSRIDVKKDQLVQKGEVLGLVGSTGRVTGPHLHWGFRAQNARVDPFSLMRISE